MKELSIEEKAKAYDEVISKLKGFMAQGVDPLITRADVQDFFPELKESEDERVRKKLIDLIYKVYANTSYITCVEHEDMLAWLEKQGEQNLIMAKSPQLGEQKSAKNIVETWKDMRLEVYQQASGNRHEPNYSDDTTKMFSLNDIDEIIEKMSEQKLADKVEPKFNFSVGQWIVATGKCVYLITKIDGFNVTLVDVDGNEYVFDTSSLEDAHLWTIQDAKDGDVLAFYCEYKGNKMIQVGIIEKYVGKHGGCSNTFKIYVGVDWENNLKIGEYMGCPDIRPATKEQRDKLFEKMHEAEYDWDTEKKELKKIEESENIKNQIMSEITDLVKDYITQKSAKCSEEDELSCFENALFTAFSDAWQQYLRGKEVDIAQWAKEHSKELLEAAKEELKGHNSARSEEDEVMIKSICEGLQDASNEFGWSDFGQTSIDSIIDWLKSFKDRIIA